MSEIEGKATRVAASADAGSERVSWSEWEERDEGKATREERASAGNERVSIERWMSEIEGKATRVGSECGQRASFNSQVDGGSS